MSLLVRKLCDARNKLPTEVEVMTLDQLMLMAVPEAELQVHTVTVEELRSIGAVPQTKPGEGTSLVKRIRAKRAEAMQKQKRMSKRERLREQKRAIRDARARGEV